MLQLFRREVENLRKEKEKIGIHESRKQINPQPKRVYMDGGER